MGLTAPRTIALDSAHWAVWLDDALLPGRARRASARTFHDRLVGAGLVPLLSWHHLEELLAIDDGAAARDRVAFIASLPLLAWTSVDGSPGPGPITHIVAAEARAALEGARHPIDVRDRAKALMLRIGTGSSVLGPDLRMWELVRREAIGRRAKNQLMAVVRPLTFFDERRTIRELAQGSIRPAAERGPVLRSLRSSLAEEIARHGDSGVRDPAAMADAFFADVHAMAPPAGMSVRDMIEATLVWRGVDRHEITDESVLADLSDLATFRHQLRVVQPLTGASFDQLKTLPMSTFPHLQVVGALRRYGQKRPRRPASDMNDELLATLAPYCDELCVDKRTFEDFRRAASRHRALNSLVGRIRKARDYEDLLQG